MNDGKQIGKKLKKLTWQIIQGKFKKRKNTRYFQLLIFIIQHQFGKYFCTELTNFKIKSIK